MESLYPARNIVPSEKLTEREEYISTDKVNS